MARRTPSGRFIPDDPTTQDVIDAIGEVNTTIGQVGVELQRLHVTIESISLTLGTILGEIRSLSKG
jgi:hypothetical protein